MADEPEVVNATVCVPCIDLSNKAYKPVTSVPGLVPGRVYTYEEIVALLGVASDNKRE